MAGKNEIISERILIKNVFEMWFRIPEYQRPYVWGNDQINDLLDDITYAMTERPDSQYFLGTFVFQKRAIGSRPEQHFEENDLMDGQQRLTTLLLLFAVLRDLSKNQKIKDTCQGCIYQEGNEFTQKPERIRLTFEHGVRESACDFIDKFVKPQDGTSNGEKISEFVKNTGGTSITNMAKAIEIIRTFWLSDAAPRHG